MTHGQWVKIAPASELAEGVMLGVEFGNLQIAIYKVEGQFYATDNVCTHALTLLTDGVLEGDVIECPLHGGCLNVKSGEGMGEPISEDLKTYRVRVEAGSIEVEIPSASDYLQDGRDGV